VDQTAVSQSPELTVVVDVLDEVAEPVVVLVDVEVVAVVVVETTAVVAEAEVSLVDVLSKPAEAVGAASPEMRAHAVTTAAIARCVPKLDFDLDIVPFLLARPGGAGPGGRPTEEQAHCQLAKNA
jgi:hypothetical protein